VQCSVKIRQTNAFHNNEWAVSSVHNVSEPFGRHEAARRDLFAKTFAKIILKELSKISLLMVLFNYL
jgi:hypothetical protein